MADIFTSDDKNTLGKNYKINKNKINEFLRENDFPQ